MNFVCFTSWFPFMFAGLILFSSFQVVDKFFEIHEKNAGFSADNTWKEKCLCLLNDSSDKWTFNDDSESFSLKYIVNLKVPMLIL